MASEGKDPTIVMNFWERLSKNPSYRSVQQLWSFLRHQGIPMVPDGCFLAYKGVRSDFKDAHSGKFDNKPGAIHSMPRNKISDDPKEACHEGFHVGALQYAKDFSDRVVVCKVSPEDVVCVPYDHSAQKMRVCKYEVVGNWNGEFMPDLVFENYRPEDDDHDEDEDRDDDFPSTAGLDDDQDDEFEEDGEDEDEDDGISQAMNQAYARGEIDESGRPKKPPTPSFGAPPPVQPTNIKAPKDELAEKRAAKKGYAKFDKMDAGELMKQPIEDLRQYAGKGLQISGAWKIPGGKTALVAQIIKVRK